MNSPTAKNMIVPCVEKILKLYVGKLPYQTTQQELADLFAQYGQVLSANIIIDRETGQSKGFGFVEMSNDQEAQEAVASLNNSDVRGRTIVVNEAHERREQRGGGGGGGGGGRYQSRDRGGYNDGGSNY